MNKQCMLSTIDNPFNPFDDFTSWFLYDVEKGHNSSSLLDRIVNVEDNMTEEEIKIETERAIDQIIFHDPEHKYIKVFMNEEVKTE